MAAMPVVARTPSAARSAAQRAPEQPADGAARITHACERAADWVTELVSALERRRAAPGQEQTATPLALLRLLNLTEAAAALAELAGKRRHRSESVSSVLTRAQALRAVIAPTGMAAPRTPDRAAAAGGWDVSSTEFLAVLRETACDLHSTLTALAAADVASSAVLSRLDAQICRLLRAAGRTAPAASSRRS